jgi:cytochrome P450
MGDCPYRIDFDYWNDTAMQDPYPVFREMRDAECPISKSEAHGGFHIATRYTEVTAVARDFRTYISGKGVSVPAFPSEYSMFPVETDKPLHTEYRRLLNDRLRPKPMDALEPTVRRLTTATIDRFIESGECELHRDVASPVVAMTIGPFIGLDEEHWGRLNDAAFEMLHGAGREDASDAFFAFMREQFDERREHPRDDLLTEMLITEITDGDARRTLTEFERLSMAWALVLAATDTSAGMTATALWYLAKHPDLRKRFVDDPSLIGANIEEFVRMFTNVMVSRTVVEPATLGGVDLGEDDRVLMCLGSANRDERQFDDPDAFRFDRSPNRHVGFGFGIHKCVGMHMAKMEFKVMAEEVLRRLPDYELTTDELVVTAGSAWQIRTLPIRFTPGVRESVGTAA